MHLSNVIFKDDKLEGFIDFEILENNVKIFDLCYCCTSVLSELFSDERLREKWLHIVSKVFEGYYKQNDLTKEELKAIWKETVHPLPRQIILCYAFNSNYLYCLFCPVTRFIKVK